MTKQTKAITRQKHATKRATRSTSKALTPTGPFRPSRVAVRTMAVVEAWVAADRAKETAAKEAAVRAADPARTRAEVKAILARAEAASAAMKRWTEAGSELRRRAPELFETQIALVESIIAELADPDREPYPLPAGWDQRLPLDGPEVRAWIASRRKK
jgi:hypothetical protein